MDRTPLVYVRYLDHVLFKDMDPAGFSAPFVRETVGWLDFEDDRCIRLVWERFAGAVPGKNIRQKCTGLVITKKDILERREIA